MNSEIDLNDKNLVKITHYVNPHLFWFKYETSFYTDEQFFEFQKAIDSYYCEHEKTTRNRWYRPQLGEIVGVYHFTWNKWIRAKVDFIFEFSPNSSVKYVLWAIDHGIPLQIEERFIRKLPRNLADAEIKAVHFGGVVDIVPAEKVYDFLTFTSKVVKCEKWSPYSINMVGNLLSDAACIRFIKKKYNAENDQIFGDIEILTHTNNLIKPEIALLESDHAIKINNNDEFFKILKLIKTNKLPRWQSNDGKPNIYKPDTKNVLLDNDRTQTVCQITNKCNNLEDNLDFEFERNIEEKVCDWQQRNEKSYISVTKLEEDLKKETKKSISEKSFHEDKMNEKFDSDKKTDLLIESDENEEIGALKIGGSTRRGRMAILKNNVPPPPSFENLNIKQQQAKQKIDNADFYEFYEKNCGKMTDSIKNKLIMLNNKRKKYLKELNVENDKENITENNKLDIMKNSDECENKNISENMNGNCLTDKNKSIDEDSISKISSINENAIVDINKEMEINIFPAGYDLKNVPHKKKAIDHKIELLNNKRKEFLSKKQNDLSIKNLSSNDSTNSFNNNSSINEKISNNNKSVQRTVLPAGINLSTLQQKKQLNIENDKSFVKVQKFINDVENNKTSNNERFGKHFKDCGETCVIDNNLTKHLVLVHGRQAKPIEKLANANFCEEVHRELENMRFTKIYRIQSYTWPHLMRGNSVVVVNSARTGKTMSYLPALCSLIRMKTDENIIPEGEGPIGIIIVPTSVEVEKISRISSRFFQNSNRKFSVIESYGVRKSESVSISLLNGCDILVTTLPSLLRILKQDIKLFDLNRLQHLVIDNIDLIHKNVQSDLSSIFKKFCSSNRSDKARMQIIITARLWHHYIYQLLKMCNNPQLCFGAYIEAAVYAKSQIKMKFVANKSKIQAIIEFLEEHPYTRERLIILCRTDDDLEEIQNGLKNLCYLVTYASGRMATSEIQWVFSKQSETMSILVCTDTFLHELKLQNAQNVIHYSLPDSWSKFTFRFSVFFDYYDDLLKNEISSKPPAVSLILLDETNNSQLPKLIEFLKSHGCDKNIPQEILNLSDEIILQREEKRIETKREFCSQLLSFGECLKQNDCKYRHHLTKHDKPNNDIPIDGIIIVKVLHIISPVHYCVRVLEHQTESETVTKQIKKSEGYANFCLEFSLYFNNSKNHQIHWPIKIDDICVIKDLDTYYRVKILEIPSKLEHAMSFNVVVKFVDTGRVTSLKSTALLAMPEKFMSFPFQAVNLRISDIVPYDYEHEWDSEAIYAVQSWFEFYDKKVKNEVVLRAHVHFSLMDTIWVDKIVIQEKLEAISCSVYTINIKKELLNKHYGVSSNVTSAMICNMAQKCGILQTKNKKLTTKKIKQKDNFKSNSLSGVSSLSSNISNSCELMNEDYSSLEKKDINSSNCISNKTQRSSSQQSKSSSSSSIDKTIIRAKTKKRRSVLNKSDNNDLTNSKEISIDEKSIENKFSEEWEILNKNDFSRVIISIFYTPYHFYIQNVENIERLEKLYVMIDNHIENKLLQLITEPNVGMNCLAKLYDKYNRAKITKVLCTAEEIKVHLFFCDFGKSATSLLNEVYCSSEEIIKFMPFQAIRCKLTGIQPISNGIWTEEICDLIYDNVIQYCEFLYAKPTDVESPKSENDLCYWKYEVIMIDCSDDTDININHKIVKEGMAIYDPDTKYHLDDTIDDDRISIKSSDEEEIWDDLNYENAINFCTLENTEKINEDISLLDCDIQFNKENILKLLDNLAEQNVFSSSQIHSLKNNIKHNLTENNLNIKNETDTIINDTKKPIKTCELTVNQDENKNKGPYVPRLKQIQNYKIPNIVWQQSETLICLSISAPDVDEYFLTVKPDHLIFIAHHGDEKSVSFINFLGIVNPQLTSHGIRGLNVIVRLVKIIKGIKWPRLTWESDKNYWLKYDYNAIVVESEQFTNTGFQNEYNSNENINLEVSSNEESDADSLNYDSDVHRENDMFDPFADDF